MVVRVAGCRVVQFSQMGLESIQGRRLSPIPYFDGIVNNNNHNNYNNIL